ncbi:hypothetical protein KAM448_05520 [Aeromonas caviae]|uniref:Uncharacterized protein n=1 Tax=Aeromonas caviae TaxID=648 RepID=A0ABD0B9C0_AERCA|nr:hypothetical protein [Aeromonas caviae]BCR29918.1 hypothetical protein KAM376_29240 [Aeromonas caviae]GJA81025.1 hypothetical protein KAM355_15850 [Aeromonas caviae]GJA98472.1 hypothetical protein KAM359_18800 [Aeromonas caviae]GJB10766.1 hypothetical protein KAM362_13260 [Aeromonas caviae]GJB23382.1 hypothetical protein KAM365_11320 [Aeromonas caviae]
MRFTHAIAAVLAATTGQPPRLNPNDFIPGYGFCIPNPRNDHAAAAKRAARRSRNKAKRG